MKNAPTPKHPRRRGRPEGIRITKVGLWYVLFTVLGAVAATNTGNNSLYMVVAMMLGALVVSGVVSRTNVEGLAARLTAPREVFANSPCALDFELTHRGRLTPRWLLLLSLTTTPGQSTPRLVARLPPRGATQGQLETIFRRRGPQTVPALHVWSLFPFGFFRKGARYPVDLEVLVYPELYAAANTPIEQSGRRGEEVSRRTGRGHDLHSLRAFRPGDDPRAIHWKQSARTGEMIVKERTAEESRRLSVLFDNGTGPLDDDESRMGFERLVSEAATVATDHLGQGFDVELVTRETRLPFAGGARQRQRVLEALARVEAGARSADPLRPGDPGARQVRFGAEGRETRRSA